jgi:hypothetical protein
VTAVLLFALLSGPPVIHGPSLSLRLHLGTDQHSAIIRSELACDHPWFVRHRLAIQSRYRLTVDDEARLFPTWQISAGPRETFRPGSFAASGTFILALKSITDIDRWERDSFVPQYNLDEELHEYTFSRSQAGRPVPFPAEVRP